MKEEIDRATDMRDFIGTKRVMAKAMTRAEYNNYRGWDLPADECGADEGRLVEYVDGGRSNHPDHEGYISWSPEGVFARSYRSPDGLTFGEAIEALRIGLRVSRAGWNGKKMFLFLVPGSEFKVNRPPLLGIYPAGTEISYCPHIDMRTADGKIVPWLASQTDVLAEDWTIDI